MRDAFLVLGFSLVEWNLTKIVIINRSNLVCF